jgi:MFS family permease
MSSGIDETNTRNLGFNFTIGMLDGAFFGLAIGFASFIAIIPLFVSHLTDSALLIGLVPAIHSVGWQFPQLLTAGWVARLRRYKPVVMWMTIHERLPFLGLAVVAWFLPQLGPRAALALTFLMLIWQGFGGGFTANAWTNMISKIVPDQLHGTFFGSQAAAFSAMAGVSAVVAGLMLEKLESPLDFTACFLAASVAMAISYLVIAFTREPQGPPKETPAHPAAFWGSSLEILKRDANFRTFLGVRILSQFAGMAFAFYIVYAVRAFGMNEALVGAFTGFLLVSQVVLSPLMGRLSDRWSHRGIMILGALAATLSALLAWAADAPAWFYAIFLMEAVAMIAIWTIPIALTVSFASREEERPLYIGMSNTLCAPATILAPIFGGWLADASGFRATFLVSAACGVLMAGVLFFLVKDPRKK